MSTNPLKIIRFPSSEQEIETIYAIWGTCALAIADPATASWACERIAGLLRDARFIAPLPGRVLPGFGGVAEGVNGLRERHAAEPA